MLGGISGANDTEGGTPMHVWLRALLILPGILFLTPEPGIAQRGKASSLLIFAEYDTRPGTLDLITVTNTDDGIASPSIRMRWDYTDGTNCSEFNRTETLTPADTLTVVAGAHNPQFGQGYLVVYATDLMGMPIAHNFLIGTSTLMDAFGNNQYAVEPFGYLGIGDGHFTDMDADGVRDLDGIEYTQVADQYAIPRFYGQGPMFDSELILIDLTGGQGFATAVDFLIYNDNEEPFSQLHTFQCWTKASLLSISGVFSQLFLSSTIHDLNEIAGLGNPQQEAGWFRLDGNITFNPQTTLLDPAILCLLVDRSGQNSSSVHPIPFGLQGNGSYPPGGGPEHDCNHNGVEDADDIASGNSADCNQNGIPDECEPDCDMDGLPDGCEVDCNMNGTPDDCENFADCNQNGVPDECDADGNGNGVPDECEPVCPGGVSLELWPPNHNYRSIDLDAVAGVTDPLGGPISIVVTSITQDEPLNGNGDGNTVCDGDGVGGSVAQIRAERAGGGDGRVYVIHYTATNQLGFPCSGQISVTVPHSQNGQPAIDSGQSFDSTGGCQ
jgi:hypothetical protein